jgi:hypothetical protein
MHWTPQGKKRGYTDHSQRHHHTDDAAVSGFANRKGKDSPECRVPFEIKTLDGRYLAELIELQEVILEGLPRSDMLQPFSESFMKEHLGNKGFIVGLISEGAVIAFRNVYFPDKDDPEWNLGRDLCLPENDLDKTANFQMVCVHPDFLGNSLALIMNRYAISILKKLGSHEHLCATVSPYNYWNINILLDSGFVIKKIKNKYGGKLRYIVHQNLKYPETYPAAPEKELPLTVFNAQEELFGAGWSGISLKGSPLRENESGGIKCNEFDVTLKNLKIGFAKSGDNIK